MSPTFGLLLQWKALQKATCRNYRPNYKWRSRNTCAHEKVAYTAVAKGNCKNPLELLIILTNKFLKKSHWKANVVKLTNVCFYHPNMTGN
jgi:hypothetical protein